MITLYGFGRIFPEGRGHTKDLWVQWALEELGLPYRVHALDHTGGELDSETFSRISPFHQAPLIELREIRKTDLMAPLPRVRAYCERCLARPAFQRALALYAGRVGVSLDEIR
jgi:glutathione S-transferase